MSMMDKMRAKQGGKTAVPKPVIAKVEPPNAKPSVLTENVVDTCQPVKQKKKSKKYNPNWNNKFRLPDGSTFHVRYDATSEKWIGELNAGGKVFSGTFGGIHALFFKLGQQWKKESEKPVDVGDQIG